MSQKFSKFLKGRKISINYKKVQNLDEIEKHLKSFAKIHFGDDWYTLEQEKVVTFMMVLIYAKFVHLNDDDEQESDYKFI